MIEKLDTFNLNIDFLLLEWQRVRSMYQGLEQGRIRITYSDLEDENTPCNVPYRSFKQSDIVDNSFFNTWRVTNILKPFQRTYTEKVVKDVDIILRKYGVRSTVVKYGSLNAGQCMPFHVDTDYIFRYHIPVKTNTGSMMIIDNGLYKMQELGSLYKVKTDLEHTALNAGHEQRVHLIFDVTPL